MVLLHPETKVTDFGIVFHDSYKQLCRVSVGLARLFTEREKKENIMISYVFTSLWCEASKFVRLLTLSYILSSCEHIPMLKQTLGKQGKVIKL